MIFAASAAASSNERECERVFCARVLKDERREARKVGGLRLPGEGDDLVRVAVEMRKDRSRERGFLRAAVMGPQRAADRLSPKPLAARFIGNCGAVAADA